MSDYCCETVLINGLKGKNRTRVNAKILFYWLPIIQWIKLNSFYFTDKTSWWKNINDDPWSEYPLFDDDFVPPELNFSENVDDNLRWMCNIIYC